MSRRPRLDYDFCPMPRRWHAAWAGSSLFETGLRDRLFELADGEPIPFDGDWLESLCKQAAVNGRERPPARKAMLDWQSRGLLIVNGQTVWICCRHDAQPRRPVVDSTHNGCTSVVRPTHNGSTSNIQLDSTPRNDLNHVGETDRQTDERERERARTRESSARFEKPPTPTAPPELPPTALEPTSWLRVWALYAEHRGLDPVQLGHPARQRDALTAVAAAAEVESGGSEGEAFDRAVRRLLGAWGADKWVKEKQPTIANLAANLHRYARAKAKPIVKLVGDASKASDCHSDADLLAWPEWREGELDIWQKQRRWELQARLERKAGAAE